MNCEKYIENINLYIDGLLNKKEAIELQDHIEGCEHCRVEYEELKKIKELLGGMNMKKLPEGFEKELRKKLIEVKEEKREKPIKMILEKVNEIFKHRKVVFSIGVIAIVAVIGIAGLNPNKFAKDEYGNIKEDNMAFTESAVAEEPAAQMKSISMVQAEDTVMADGADSGSGIELSGLANSSYIERKSASNNFEGRLIIKNADLAIEVLDFDSSANEIIRITNELNGYVSSSNSYFYRYDNQNSSKNLKSGNISIRIPSELFDSVLGNLGDLGKVTNTNLYSEDISKIYRDTADEVKNLETREARIREIMVKAEKIEDILKIEEELSRVRSEINRLKGSLSNWEDLVSLSTINISITEVEDTKNQIIPVDENVFEKAHEGLIETINKIIKNLQKFFIYIVTNLPIIVLGVIVLIIGIKKFKKIKLR